MLFEFDAVKNIVIGPASTVYPPPPVPVPVVNAPVAAPMPINLADPPPPGMILPVMFGVQTWKESFTIRVLVFRKQQELSLFYPKPLAVKGIFLTITTDMDIHSPQVKEMICTTETNFKYPHFKHYAVSKFNAT